MLEFKNANGESYYVAYGLLFQVDAIEKGRSAKSIKAYESREAYEAEIAHLRSYGVTVVLQNAHPKPVLGEVRYAYYAAADAINGLASALHGTDATLQNKSEQLKQVLREIEECLNKGYVWD